MTVILPNNLEIRMKITQIGIARHHLSSLSPELGNKRWTEWHGLFPLWESGILQSLMTSLLPKLLHLLPSFIPTSPTMEGKNY